MNIFFTFDVPSSSFQSLFPNWNKIGGLQLLTYLKYQFLVATVYLFLFLFCFCLIIVKVISRQDPVSLSLVLTARPS